MNFKTDGEILFEKNIIRNWYFKDYESEDFTYHHFMYIQHRATTDYSILTIQDNIFDNTPKVYAALAYNIP